MIKDIINSNESKNIHDDDIQFLKEHFPSCFTKQSVDYSGNIIPSKFDIEKLRKIIDPKIDIIQEGYGLDFLGKTYARYISSLQSETVLVPDTEHNSKDENKTSENIYISGDNIDALKHLLKSYEQNVKCIYIDPPYNTGSDNFVYKDNFDFSKDDLQKKLNLSSNEAERVLDLTNRGSSSHSAWLMFMYPRLLLARGLLKDDGVIFISIDDNEQANLKLLCDDVFGEDNFVDCLKWKKKKQPSFLAKHTAKVMEFVFVYAKNKDSLEKLSIEGTSDSTKKVINVSNNECIRYFDKGVKVKIGDSGIIKAGRYKVKTMEVEYLSDVPYNNGHTLNAVNVKSKFSESQERISKFISEDLLFITAKYGLRRDVSEEEIGKRKSITDLLLEEWGDNQESDKEQIAIFGKKCFSFTKPIKLIQNFIRSNFTENQIILDFFAGSSTTAEAVMKQCLEDSEKRQFIMVQLPETVRKGSEAEKSGYKTIDQIGMKRIELAAAKIKSENTNLFSDENPLDLGFKHYTLKAVPQNTLDKLESFSESTLISDSSILSEFGEPTVLATWMCHDGYRLTSPYTEIDLGGYTAYLCGKHLYFINAEFTEKNVLELCKLYEEKSDFTPDKIVVFGYSFTMSVLNTLKANVRVFKDTEKNLDISVDIRY